MTVDYDQARAAQQAVINANRIADELEQRAREAREQVSEEAKRTNKIHIAYAQVQRDQQAAAEAGYRQLRKEADALLRAKPDTSRPSLEARGRAREVLKSLDAAHDSIKTLPVLAREDFYWAQLSALQERVQHHITAVVMDRATFEATDDLECQLHRAIIGRLKFLAGESE
jgi:hypothetical protein